MPPGPHSASMTLWTPGKGQWPCRAPSPLLVPGRPPQRPASQDASVWRQALGLGAFQADRHDPGHWPHHVPRAPISGLACTTPHATFVDTCLHLSCARPHSGRAGSHGDAGLRLREATPAATRGRGRRARTVPWTPGCSRSTPGRVLSRDPIGPPATGPQASGKAMGTERSSSPARRSRCKMCHKIIK